MDSDAIFINPGVRHEPLETSHLVLHLDYPTLTMDGTGIVGTMVGCAAIVDDEEDVAALSHIHLPSAKIGLIVVADELGVWTTIDVEDDWILLSRIEIERTDEAIVVEIFAIGARECA